MVTVRAVTPVSVAADVALDARDAERNDERRGQEHDLPHWSSFGEMRWRRA